MERKWPPRTMVNRLAVTKDSGQARGAARRRLREIAKEWCPRCREFKSVKEGWRRENPN